MAARPVRAVLDMQACEICGNESGNREFTAREMMFGLRDEFGYLECAACGCVQRTTAVQDPSRFYPASYYSFVALAESHFTRFLKRMRLAYIFEQRSWLGRLLVRRFGVPLDLAAVKRAGIGRNDSVLDVGCGDGQLLRALHEAGFSRLRGIDPFLAEDRVELDGVPLCRLSLGEAEGAFDWLMMHHSFEHMPAPLDALRDVVRLLRPGGRALIRIPLAGSYAWRMYGTDWVQLDAPRHAFLHTPRSLRLLAKAAGLVVEAVDYDSTGFQFWGSEQYRRGIPLIDPDSGITHARPRIFSSAELRDFAARAGDLNRRGDGDQACFRLRKA